MNPEEIRRLLAELDERLGAELAGFWHSIAGEVSSDEFRDLMVSAYPEIVTPYIAAAADLGATVYDLAPSDNPDFKAQPAELASVEKLQASASWALNTGSGEAALALLQGSATRSMFDGYRDTTVENAAAEPGAKWVRHASANACGFCRMQATRGAVYHSEQSAGGSHDGCHCIAVMVRPGQDYTPPPYVEQWKDDYIAARQDGLTEPKDIAKAMDNAPTGKATLARQAKEASHAKDQRLRATSSDGIKPPKDPGGPGRTGFGSPNDDEARKILQQAASAEPQVTRAVQAAAGSDGTLRRLDTRLKTEASVVEKIDRLAKRGMTPEDVHDAIRYTWVGEADAGYWSASSAVIDRLRASGHEVIRDPGGWTSRPGGYRGRNVEFRSPEGATFEVQFHTGDSFQAAEDAHKLYEKSRSPEVGSSEKKRLARAQREIFSSVPWPADVPEV